MGVFLSLLLITCSDIVKEEAGLNKDEETQNQGTGDAKGGKKEEDLREQEKLDYIKSWRDIEACKVAELKDVKESKIFGLDDGGAAQYNPEEEITGDQESAAIRKCKYSLKSQAVIVDMLAEVVGKIEIVTKQRAVQLRI